MSKPQSNRRQFLIGQAAVDAISNIDDKSPGPHYSSDPKANYLLQVDRRAMACEFQILLNSGEDVGATEAALEAMDLVERLEEQLSWFRESSELSRINRAAASSPFPIESRLFKLLSEATTLSEATGGAFDITAAPLWELWGFHRHEGKLPSDGDIQKTLERTGSDKIQLDPETESIRFLHDEIEINLGAIGKGYALDRCAELLQFAGIDNFVIHGGQSSMLANGSRTGEEEPNWTVALRHPLRPDQRLAEIRLRDRALGTSGTGNQFFHHAGKRYGHILDPRTGYPASNLLSATALAPTARQADALATAFFVMGHDATVAFCESRPDVGALLVRSGERAGSLELVSIGVEPCDWRHVA